MRTKKTIDTTNPLLSGLAPDAKALYFTLLLHSDDAGLIQVNNNYYGHDLDCLIDTGLVRLSATHIVLLGYFQANYGNRLNKDYNPHKPIFETIQKASFEYDPITNELDIPKNDCIIHSHSLIKPKHDLTNTLTNQAKDNASQVIISAQPKILTFLTSNKATMYVALALILVQSIHTSFTIMDLSHIPNPYNTITSIFTSLMMDMMILYFVVNKQRSQSLIFFVWCALMNIYSLHLATEYWTYKSFFSFVVAIGIPYAVHSVSTNTH